MEMIFDFALQLPSVFDSLYTFFMTPVSHLGTWLIARGLAGENAVLLAVLQVAMDRLEFVGGLTVAELLITMALPVLLCWRFVKFIVPLLN